MNRVLLLFFCAVLALLFSLSQPGCAGCHLVSQFARTGKAGSSLESGIDTALSPMAPHLIEFGEKLQGGIVYEK